MKSVFERFSLLSATVFLVTLTAANPAFCQQAQDTDNKAPEIEQLSPFSQKLKAALEASLAAVKGKRATERLKGIGEHYRQHRFEPIWIVDNRPSRKAHQAVEVLRQSHLHGLDPQDYDGEALFQYLGTSNIDTKVDLEVKLTRSVVAYAQHLNAGRLAPQTVNSEIVVFPQAMAAADILEKLRITKTIQLYLRFTAPHTPRYERLRVAIGNYKTIARNGGWTKIYEGEVLKPGMSGPRVLLVRKRMIEDGRGPVDENASEVYDESLVKAVKDFQIRHGLADDGVIGPNTLAQFNVSVEDRIRTMVINLERRRWIQNNYGRYYLFVNLADQALKLVRDEKNLHFEIIQVGKSYHRTPVFTEMMEYIEFNPYWNVPYSIATKEYLPKLKTDPGLLDKQNIRVLANGNVISPYSVPWNDYSRRHFPVRLRQDSGSKNALGRVKFMFPNRFNVYIHDTPSKSNFNKTSRYFSHGCLRLRNPLTMAEKILRAQGWSRKKIDAVVASGKRTIVKLKKKIPVYVTYLTAWVNKDGSVNFRRDIYGRDKILDKALKKASAG